MDGEGQGFYRDRFENLFRVAKKITACLHIGDILEQIRDEIKVTVPHAREACIVLVDPDAPSYTRPLHCAVEKGNINCHLCKRGRAIVQCALAEAGAGVCAIEQGDSDQGRASTAVCELAVSMFHEEAPLAVLTVVSEPGAVFDDRDKVLLADLADLATNTIVNAKKYSKMAGEKLSLERILGHIEPFVPETVRRIVEKNPEAPALEKREADVTVLFLDVADYTRISERLSREKIDFIIEKYFSAFLDIIYSCEGDINETAGDGLMAIFQGEESENAAHAAEAAMRIRRRTREINRELEGRFFPIEVNMGLNSGKASVGANRYCGEFGLRVTFTATGPVTNLAARLASEAKDGDILVGPETARRIGQRVTLFNRGPMNFKNVQDRVHVFSLTPR